MTNRIRTPAVLHKTLKVKTSLLARFIVGVCLASSMSSQAGLSYVGSGYVEVSTAQNNPVYTSVSDNENGGSAGYSLGNLSTIYSGQSLFLGGQIQTYPVQNGNATLFFRIGTSGTYYPINLAYSGSSWGPYSNNNGWDSSGNVNYNHTYYSQDISGSLTYGTTANPNVNTVEFYFSATDTDNNITMTDGSAANPFSFTITAVPEPITLALPIFGGLFGIAGIIRHLKKRHAILVAVRN